MPRYHFALFDGTREPDHEGIELADDQAAQACAMKYAGEIMKSDPNRVLKNGQCRVEVTNHSGALLFTVVTITIEAAEPAA